MFDRIYDRQVSAARADLQTSFRLTGDRPRVGIIPPAIPGSVGDAAMISATAAYWYDHGAEYVDLLYGKDWPLDVQFRRKIPSSGFFYGGSAKQHVAILRALKQYTHLYFIGADVIDGAYNPKSVNRRLSLIRDFAASGSVARVLGASYNETPEITTQQSLANMPAGVEICARDPVSFARLDEVEGIVPRQVADLAFLLKPQPDNAHAVAANRWIAQQKAEGRQVVALNANYLQIAKEPKLKEALPIIVQRFIDAGLALLLVPHDSRTDEPDAFHLKAAVAGLAPEFADRTYLIEAISPGAIKASLANVDLLVTGRLHAQILAMGSGTPVVSLAYQGKFEGLLQLFEINPDDLLVTPKSVAVDPHGFADHVIAMLPKAGELRRKISDRMPFITSMSQRNFTNDQ